MSQSNYSSEASSSQDLPLPPPVAGAAGGLPTSSPSGGSPGAAANDALQNHANQPARQKSAGQGSPQQPGARPLEAGPPGPAAPVPPPPPPRAAPPPVRPPAGERSLPSGVGSARSPRWRGELEPIEPRTAARENIPPGDDDEALSERAGVIRAMPPWLISTIIHLILLLLLALISTPAGGRITRVVLTIGESSEQSPTELAEFDIEPAEAVEETVASSEESPVDVESLEFFDAADIAEPTELMPVELGAAEISAPAMFSSRSGAMKQALLAMYGGTQKTEDAVANGLAWLKRNQQSGGYWSLRGPYSDGGFSENRIAATAMALLAFLGDGHTHQQGEYQAEVEKGLDFLLQQQDRSGFLARSVKRDQHQMYAQAQATIVLCEAYAMTKDSRLRPHAQAALDFAAEAQSPEGGWRYRPRFDADTSMTGWFVMGLQSGRSAGLQVDISVLNNVSRYLDTVQSYEGAAYAYKPQRAPSPSMTAEGLLCRQYLGWDRDYAPMGRGVEALLIDAPFDITDRDVYYWYYATQVLHHFGGSPWRQWNEAMRVELPEAQIKRGREAGSWPPQGDAYQSSGRLYTTCLSIYCLEVYYRHMPLYGEQAVGGE